MDCSPQGKAHIERDTGDRQFFPWDVHVLERTRVRRREDGPLEALGRHVQIHHEGEEGGIEGVGPLQDGGVEVGLGRDRVRDESVQLGFFPGVETREGEAELHQAEQQFPPSIGDVSGYIGRDEEQGEASKIQVGHELEIAHLAQGRRILEERGEIQEPGRHRRRRVAGSRIFRFRVEEDRAKAEELVAERENFRDHAALWCVVPLNNPYALRSCIYISPLFFFRSASLAVPGEHRQDGRRECGGDQGGSSSVESGREPESWRGGLAGREERFDAVRQRAVVQRVAEQDRPPARVPPSIPTPGPGQERGGGGQEREESGERARVGDAAPKRAEKERTRVEFNESVRGGEQQTILSEFGPRRTSENNSRVPSYRPLRERERIRGPAKFILLIFVLIFVFVVVIVIIVGSFDQRRRKAKPVGSFSRLEKENGRESREQRRVSSLDRVR